MGDLVLPSVCAGCQARDGQEGGLCRECHVALLDMVCLRYCPRCGTTLGPGLIGNEDGCWLCPTEMTGLEAVVRIGPYAGCLKWMVRRLKYHRMETTLGLLCDLLAARLATMLDSPAPEVIVPVPQHWRRRLARGYDHTAAIAGALDRRLGIAAAPMLRRIRPGPTQASLPRSRRFANVRGAFEAVSSRLLRGADVLLLDDVTTTGATASAAATALRKAGARRVRLAVLAKADPPRAYSQQGRTGD